MPAQAAVPGEAVLEQLRQQALIIRERHHAVANVPRGENAIFPAQTPRTPTVVSDRDDRRKVRDGPGSRSWPARRNVFLQAAQECGQSRPASESHDACRLEPFLYLTSHKGERGLGAGAISLRIQQFGEAGVFLQEREILVVSGVIAILRPQLDGELQLFEGSVRFASQAVE